MQMGKGGRAAPFGINTLRARLQGRASLHDRPMRVVRPSLFRLVCACCMAISIAPAMAASPVAADPAGLSDVIWSPAAIEAADASFIGHGSARQEAPAGESNGYNWRGAALDQPDWRGVRRDITYFLGYQFAAIGVLYVAPESVSGWDSEQKRSYDFSKWRNNIKPVWDEDVWWINYVTHPYWGGAYYIQARERGLDRTQAFWYSSLISTLFEFGAEALAEPASIQDLVVTPVMGFLVGEYVFTPLRQRIRAKPGKLDWSAKTILFATDPLGVLSAQTDRLLGAETTLRWQPIGMQNPALAAGMDPAVGAPGHPRSAVPVWGLQFRADW
jgi:hypothetical protein